MKTDSALAAVLVSAIYGGSNVKDSEAVPKFGYPKAVTNPYFPLADICEPSSPGLSHSHRNR